MGQEMLCLPYAGGINMANALDMAMAMAMVKIHHFYKLDNVCPLT